VAAVRTTGVAARQQRSKFQTRAIYWRLQRINN